jgi:hypothetical protein
MKRQEANGNWIVEDDRIELCGNSTATLYNNSTATLHGNSTATLHDFSHASLRGGTATAISPRATITKVWYPKSIISWCALKGIKPTGNGKACKIRLWKTVREDYGSFKNESIKYVIGEIVVAPDWDASYADECGCGLHLADSPSGAIMFVPYGEKFKLLEIEAFVRDCICKGGNMDYPMKIRARACKVLREVDPKDAR